MTQVQASHTASIRSLYFLSRILQRQGISAAEADGLLALQSVDRISGLERVPLARMIDACSRVTRRTADPLILFQCGAHSAVVDSSLGTLVMSCKDVPHALAVVNKFQTVFQDGVELAFEPGSAGSPEMADSQAAADGALSETYQTTCRATYRLNGHEADHVKDLVELKAGLSIGVLLAAVGDKQYQLLKEVHFSHAPRADVASYQQIYGCPVYFNQTESAIVFDSSVLTRPIISQDVFLNRMLVQEFEQLERCRRCSTMDFSRQVLELFESVGSYDLPTLAKAAVLLDVSPATLKRKLSAELTSYGRLAIKYRLSAADRLLKSLPEDGDLQRGLAVVAEQLAFSSRDAFIKFYKRHVGFHPRYFKQI